MYNSKISPQLQLALKYQGLLLPQTFIEITGNTLSSPIWEVLVSYVGDLEYIKADIPIEVEVISDNFAIVYINKNDIEKFAEYPNVVFVELPEVMRYILESAIASTCTVPVISEKGKFRLTGKGVLIGVIDSGIDYTHPDFIDEYGDTRIAYLWDQTIKGNPPEGFNRGTEYTREQINAALKAPTKEQREMLVPSIDVLGHGTAIAGIAGGNGNGSNKKYIGMAQQSEFIIVKLGRDIQDGYYRGPQNVEVMLATKYIIQQAIKLEMPVSILIGLGINEGSHDGENSLEIFLGNAGVVGKTNIVVGTGNQTNKDSHAEGTIKEGEEKDIQIYIAPNQKYYFFTLWTGFANELGMQIEAPTGEKTELLEVKVNNRAYIFGNTIIMVNFSEPSSVGTDNQIIVFLESADGTVINSGIWNVTLTGIDVTDGKYDIWGSDPNPEPNIRNTRFVQPNPNTTLTIPSTTSGVTSVAAYNHLTNQITDFSGRGYTRNGEVKPDITAPGVDIMAPNSRDRDNFSDQLYTPVTGTSAASAFVAGAYALLMEYGITQKRDLYLFGGRLKAYTLKNAKQLPSDAPYPNNKWGYGTLCVENIVLNLQERYGVSK